MSDVCVFCKIIRKELTANLVYEDDDVIAFLSNRPVNEGHTLVVPKKHYVDIHDVPELDAANLFGVTKRIASCVRDAMVPAGIRIVQNNGAAAGQVVFHLHVHIIPLTPRDDIHNSGVYRNVAYLATSQALERDAEKIRACLS
jgi:histidine triad (HIT) family protein